MSKMGVGDWDIDQNPISLGPDFALSAESRVKTVISPRTKCRGINKQRFPLVSVFVTFVRYVCLCVNSF